MFLHHLCQIDRPDDVVFIVLHRFLKAFTYRLLCRKMHDSINGFTFALILNEQVIQELIVKYIALMEANSRIDLFLTDFFGQYLFDPFEYIVETVRHIIDNDYFRCSLFDDAYYGVRPYKSESSRHE